MATLFQALKKNFKCCDACISSLGGNTPYGLQHEKLTVLKRFNDNALFFVIKIRLISSYS